MIGCLLLLLVQSLSLCVQADNLPGQARAFGTLADLYSQTGQVMKAHEYYKKVRMRATHTVLFLRVLLPTLYLQLVHVFEQIGDRDSLSMASRYVHQTEEALERQKRILKRQKGKKKRNKVNGDGRRGKKQGSRHGSLDNLLVSDSPMVRGKGNVRKGSKDKGKQQQPTWSPGLKRWYGVRANNAWSSPLVLENRHAKEALGLNTRRNLYRTSGISEQLNEHRGDLDSFLRAVRPSFYTLGDFMGADVLQSDTEGNGSVTEYEEMEDDPFQLRQQALLFGSVRHVKDLRQVGHSLLSKSVSDPGADGAREEWAEWLRSHGMGPEDE